MEELLSNPLSAVQQLFEERGVEGMSRVRDLFSSCLLPENLNKIPLLSSSMVYRDGTLVRYRGMVQDQYDPEMYCRVYEAVNHKTGHKIKYFGQFRDIDAVPPGYEVDFDAPCTCHGDRTTLYCVPVPGETAWVIDSHKPHPSTLTDSVPTQHGCAKRKMSDGEESDGEMEIESDSPQLTKKARDMSASTSVIQKNEDIPSLNYPLPGETRSPCLVKVYREEEVFSVTAIVEFVGILSNDPALTSFSCEENGDADSFPQDSVIEQRAHSPPVSLVPRLHCIAATLLTQTNPLLPFTLPTPTTTTVFQSVGCNVLACREAVVDMLSTVLLGDRLAAEYVLFHLISSVYGRSDMLALGKFSINLTCSPTYLATVLHDLIRQIVSKIHILPLTLDTMNNAEFSPHKDYTANRLIAGRLQLAPGTLLMVDETALQAGQLSEKGVNNLTSLGYLIQWQKLKYDFHYHTMEFECDLPVMILSEARSILSVDCKVPLNPTTEGRPSCDALIADLPDNLLHQIRQYLTIARQLDYNLDAGLKKALEDEFVEMRKNDSAMNADTFHHLLSLARLVSLSYGENTLSAEQWAIAKRLDCLRQARIT